MLGAVLMAGLLALLASSSFYLFELERSQRQQSAALAHFLGQMAIASEQRWQEAALTSAARAGVQPPPWQLAPEDKRLFRQLPPRLHEGGDQPLRFPLDNAWLMGWSRPDLRLFLVHRGETLATSLGDAGAGEAAALDPLQRGLVRRGEQWFVQVPMRWDNHPDAPLLVAQQGLALLFSLSEVAAAGLLLWALLAGMVWLMLGIWLQEALRQVQFLAYHDPLTGLINRTALLSGLPRMLAESRRSGHPLAVLYLDLDRFKNINDSLGHEAGDQLLVEVARRLKASVRETDSVARLGGDEFVLVLGQLSDPRDAATVAGKLIQSLAKPMRIGTQTLHTGTSIGIALFPDDAEQEALLLKHADCALYAAKSAGRGCFQFFAGQNISESGPLSCLVSPAPLA